MVVSEKIQVWLKREGYEPVSDNIWERVPRYFVRADVPVPVRLFAYVTEESTTFDMEMCGKAKHYKSDVCVREIPEDVILKNGRGIEHRLTDAWNDLNS